MIPYTATKWHLNWLVVLVELCRDGNALRELWWQSSISQHGVNEAQRLG
jgi:hypothetical protein